MGGGGAGAGSHGSFSPADEDHADQQDDDHRHNTAHDAHCHVHLAAGSLQRDKVLTDVSQELFLVIKTFVVEVFVLEILDNDVGVQCAGVRSGGGHGGGCCRFVDINSDHIADGTTIPLLVKCYYGVVEYLICPGHTRIAGLVSAVHCWHWQGVSVDEDSLQITN